LPCYRFMVAWCLIFGEDSAAASHNRSLISAVERGFDRNITFRIFLRPLCYSSTAFSPNRVAGLASHCLPSVFNLGEYSHAIQPTVAPRRRVLAGAAAVVRIRLLSVLISPCHMGGVRRKLSRQINPVPRLRRRLPRQLRRPRRRWRRCCPPDQPTLFCSQRGASDALVGFAFTG
jgi:hypothetical protein